jgi:ATP-binding cassette subfamily B protein
MVSRLSTFYTVAPGQLALMLLCTGLTTGLSLAVPWLLKGVLDAGLTQHQMRQVYLAGGILVATTAARAVAAYGQSYLAASLAQHLAYRLRQQVYAQIQRLSCAEHDRTRTGELMSRATSDVEAIREFFHFGMPIGLSLVLTGTGTLVALAWLDRTLAVLVLVSVPLFLGVIVGLSRALRPLQARVQERCAALAVVVQESLTGIRVVKAFAREHQQVQTFTAVSMALAQAHLQSVSTEALYCPSLHLLLALIMALVLWLGGQQVIAGTMSLGTLVAALGYLTQLAQPLRRLTWLTGVVSLCQAGGERLFEVLETVPAVRDAPQARSLPPLRGLVRFERVSFHYRGDVPVLHDISFTAAPGQVIALLGSTGSGKTTLAQLLPRFYDVTHGRITLDGIDIRTIRLAELRQQIGMVMQETFLFSTTIRHNIAYGRDDLHLDAIIAPTMAARAHDFIMQLPDGYDACIGERGVTLSGGQCQRLAIARAFVRNPRLLILDDATSSVDTETAWLIQQALTELMAGRTTFIIAQRLCTLQQADVILVLEGGRLVQCGTHHTLVDQPGLYRRLYELQWRDQEACHREPAGTPSPLTVHLEVSPV